MFNIFLHDVLVFVPFTVLPHSSVSFRYEYILLLNPMNSLIEILNTSSLNFPINFFLFIEIWELSGYSLFILITPKIFICIFSFGFICQLICRVISVILGPPLAHCYTLIIFIIELLSYYQSGVQYRILCTVLCLLKGIQV